MKQFRETIMDCTIMAEIPPFLNDWLISLPLADKIELRKGFII